MTPSQNKLRLVVVTTADDLDEEFNLNQPLRVVFNRALQAVGGQGSRDQFTLEYNDTELKELDRSVGQWAEQLGWTDGAVIELIPKPVVV